MKPDLTQLTKKLVLPSGFAAPRRLEYEGLVATTLTREDLDDDLRAVNANLALIERTRGGEWPSGPVTSDEDFVDLVWHEQEFREGTSFAYVVRDRAHAYLGCAYLYPLGRRTQLTELLLRLDVDVSWWVTSDAYADGHYATLHAALQRWIADEFPFEQAFYSNREIPPW